MLLFLKESGNQIQNILKETKNQFEFNQAISSLINRIVGKYHEAEDFVTVLNKSMNPTNLDTFEVNVFCIRFILIFHFF
jgi:hypothetical protein